MIRHYMSCYLNSMELMRSIEFLVLKLIVIGNRVLSIPEEYKYWRVYDIVEQ